MTGVVTSLTSPTATAAETDATETVCEGALGSCQGHREEAMEPWSRGEEEPFERDVNEPEETVTKDATAEWVAT